MYNLPFNMNTFNRLWGVTTPAGGDGGNRAAARRPQAARPPKNLEEQAISLVGTDIYEKLVKGYTEKQWGRPMPANCRPLSSGACRCGYTYDNNYFNDLYQGIPMGGYTVIVDKHAGRRATCG